MPKAKSPQEQPRTVTGPTLLVRLSAAEKLAIERAAKRDGYRYPAQWARENLLTLT